MKKYLAAVCQMDSQANKEENLKKAESLVREAAGKGARIAVLPEMMNYMGERYREQGETVPGRTSQFLCSTAEKCGIWLAGGSFPVIPEGERRPPAEQKPENTMFLVSPEGRMVSRYSKIHLFDVEIENGVSYRESDMSTSGDRIAVAETELGKIGFAICYDIRFPELFRLMALAGAEIICIPASFTLESGKDHWEMLLRARAVENGVYILAANQTGKKTVMNTYGNSMVIDPWGTVKARAGEREECIFAEIDLDYLASVRRQVPVLKNRREDVYQLSAAIDSRK